MVHVVVCIGLIHQEILAEGSCAQHEKQEEIDKHFQ